MAETKKKERKEKKEKPLEKWTVKELREEILGFGKYSGVHGMNKEELLEIMRTEKGIAPPTKKKQTTNVRELKKKITELKATRDEERQAGATRERLNILRRKISRMKKRTRI